MHPRQNYDPARLVIERKPSGLLVGTYAPEPGLIVMGHSIGELHEQARELLPLVFTSS